LILPGRYHEEVVIDEKFGSEEKPFVIEGYGDSHPILDGTTEIKGKFLDDHGNPIWKKLDNDKNLPIYYTPYDQKVWQLFIDGEMMTNARWPNAKWSDKSIFEGSLWGKATGETTDNVLHDKDAKLSESGIDAKGAIAVLNIASWETYVSTVIGHERGQSWFAFNNTWGHMEHLNAKNGQYFLEAKMEFLDHEEEWFIDDKNIYVWAPKGMDPAKAKVVGKKSEFAFTITNSANIVFKNMDFFATTIKTIPYRPSRSKIGNLRFENLNFQYPSYSRRILGEAAKPKGMNIDADSRFPDEQGDLSFLNCTWYGSDGIPLSFSGNKVILRNNLWESNDWSVANNGGSATIMSENCNNVTFIRNNLLNNGASAGFHPKLFALAQYNDISGQCWGMGQSDGSGIQIVVNAQNAHSIVTRNWVHDSPKQGIRFDSPNHGSNWDRIGKGATMRENVVWNAIGIMVKGDNQTVIQNMAFAPSYCLNLKNERLKPHINVPHWIGQNPIPFNNHTKVIGNIADFSNGGKSRITKKRIPMSGGLVADNFPQPWDACDDVVANLVDFSNHDFRPKVGSAYAKAGAGPYRAGLSAEYWIPGRQALEASRPIPANGAKIHAPRDALIFLQGFEAEGHDIYFSTHSNAVIRRNPKALLQRLEGSSNMVALPRNLKAGTNYFWAVDARSGNEVRRGDLWSFSLASLIRK